MEGDPVIAPSESGSTEAREVQFEVLGGSWEGRGSDRVPLFPTYLDIHKVLVCAVTAVNTPDSIPPCPHAVEVKWQAGRETD